MEFGKWEDLHCHSSLSACCTDERLTPQAIWRHAQESDYQAVCLTDHLWDAAIPGSSPWYAPQDIDHVRQALPLPAGGVPFFFGCETELPACGVPALKREHFDLFDFVVIPPNHMHMAGLVRPEGIETPRQMARLMEDRLENLLEQDLPFAKIGIAHLTCHLMFKEGSVTDVVCAMDESRLLRILEGYAKAGAGIELNAAAFGEWPARGEDALRIYRMAKAAGCRFYLSSDAHTVESMDRVGQILPAVIEALGLCESDRYVIPVKK